MRKPHKKTPSKKFFKFVNIEFSEKLSWNYTNPSRNLKNTTQFHKHKQETNNVISKFTSLPKISTWEAKQEDTKQKVFQIC